MNPGPKSRRLPSRHPQKPWLIKRYKGGGYVDTSKAPKWRSRPLAPPMASARRSRGRKAERRRAASLTATGRRGR